LTALSYEFELVALAVLLYLYDSTVLLSANEAVFIRARRDAWQVSTGWKGFLVGGRTVCVLNPLMPYAPCAKLRWDLCAAGPTQSNETWSTELPKLIVAAPWVISAAFALFILLPLGLFTPLGIYAILTAVAVLYGSILVALVLLRRAGLLRSMSTVKFIGLIFECLACPPFGVNIIRRVALMSKVNESLLGAGQRLLTPPEWLRVRAHCVAVLDQELLACEDKAPERPALEAQRARLSEQITSS
jgi:hypothetical protein